jgi:type II secretory pathway pseudopilin PulG
MTLRRNQGYSIVEILIYLAIFTILSVLVINSFITVTRSFSTTRTNRDLLESGSGAMDRISREIRQAKSVDVPNSTFGTSPGVLSLSSTDSGGTAETVKFIVESGALNVYINGTLVGNLIDSNISVYSLIFRHITTTEGEGVKIELTLQDTPGPTPKLEKFYDTILLRGNY